MLTLITAERYREPPASRYGLVIGRGWEGFPLSKKELQGKPVGSVSLLDDRNSLGGRQPLAIFETSQADASNTGLRKERPFR